MPWSMGAMSVVRAGDSIAEGCSADYGINASPAVFGLDA